MSHRQHDHEHFGITIAPTIAATYVTTRTTATIPTTALTTNSPIRIELKQYLGGLG